MYWLASVPPRSSSQLDQSELMVPMRGQALGYLGRVGHLPAQATELPSMRKWRASLVRRRARVLGDVEALTRQEAEATAIKKFDLDDEQRSRLVVQERGQSPAPLRVSAFVATMSQFT